MPEYKYAIIFKALADDTRLRIIHVLRYGEHCACALLEEFEFSQPTLSYHMKILTDSGLVIARKDGVWTRYTLNVSLIAHLEDYLKAIQADPVSAPVETAVKVSSV